MYDTLVVKRRAVNEIGRILRDFPHVQVVRVVPDHTFKTQDSRGGGIDFNCDWLLMDSREVLCSDLLRMGE